MIIVNYTRARGKWYWKPVTNWCMWAQSLKFCILWDIRKFFEFVDSVKKLFLTSETSLNFRWGWIIKQRKSLALLPPAQFAVVTVKWCWQGNGVLCHTNVLAAPHTLEKFFLFIETKDTFCHSQSQKGLNFCRISQFIEIDDLSYDMSIFWSNTG